MIRNESYTTLPHLDSFESVEGIEKLPSISLMNYNKRITFCLIAKKISKFFKKNCCCYKSNINDVPEIMIRHVSSIENLSELGNSTPMPSESIVVKIPKITPVEPELKIEDA